MSRHTSCEMCAIQPEFNSPVAQICAITDLTLLNVNEPQRIPNPRKINTPSHLTDTDFDNDIRPPLTEHLTYGAEAVYHIQSQANMTSLPKYDGVEDMTTTLQHLHMTVTS